MTFSEILKEINDIKEDKRDSYAYDKYGRFFPKDIIHYLFVRHCNCYSLDLFRYFDYINLANCKIDTRTVTTEEIFTVVDYAPPCTFREENLEAYDLIKHLNFWPNGTWSAPILVVERDGKLLAIDGNNRLRMLRAYIKHSNCYVNASHLINVLVEE